MKRTLPAFICGIIAILAGCNTGTQWIEVKGTVKYDGALVKTGQVEFESVDGKNPSAKGGAIEDGVYAAMVPAGDLRVKITGNKVVGQKPMMEGDPNSKKIDITVPLLPKKYNSETTLKVTVTERKFDLDFNLEK